MYVLQIELLSKNRSHLSSELFSINFQYFDVHLQNELSVQFDDLFKKAWEEDVPEIEKDGKDCLTLVIFFVDSSLCKVDIQKML